MSYGWDLFWERWLLPMSMIGLSVVLLFCVYMSFLVVHEREQFIIDHNCKVVARRAGQTVVTTGANGSIHVGGTSPQTTYLCDDGVEYTW
jgi:hypothetical protein